MADTDPDRLNTTSNADIATTDDGESNLPGWTSRQLIILKNDLQASMWGTHAESLGGGVRRDGLKALKDRRKALSEVMSIVSRQRQFWPAISTASSTAVPQPSRPECQQHLSRLPFESLCELAHESGYAFQDLLSNCGPECGSDEKFRFSDIDRAYGSDTQYTTHQKAKNLVYQISKAGFYDEDQMRTLQSFYRYLHDSITQEEAERKAQKKEKSLHHRLARRVESFLCDLTSSKTASSRQDPAE